MDSLARLQFVQHEIILAHQRINKLKAEIPMREKLLSDFEAEEQRLKEELGVIDSPKEPKRDPNRLKVHEAAKAHNVTSKELVEALQALGIDAKNHLSYVTQEDVDKVFNPNGGDE